MNITQVKIFPVHEDKLKAFVSLVFDHDFMVNDIKVIQGRDGLFLSMPSRRKKNGEFKDVAHPLNNKTRRMLEERVLAEYRQMVDDPTPRRPDRVVEENHGPAPDSVRELGSATEPFQVAHKPLDSQGDARAGQRTAAPPQVGSTSDSGQGVVIAAEEAKKSGDQTLDEVTEHHLSDQFWSVS